MVRGDIAIDLIGVLHVSGPNGENLTPRGARLRALLGVLALSPRKTVSRRWLETLLWPDRGADQASGSLRQALSSIRRSLGASADMLQTNRLDVSLADEGIQIDVFDRFALAQEKIRSGREMLEGIDIPSENFEDWLRQERAVLSARVYGSGTENARLHPEVKDGEDGLRAARALNPVFYTSLQPTGTNLGAFIAESISSQLSKTATEYVRTDVVQLDGRSVPLINTPGGKCTIHVSEYRGKFHVLLRMFQEPTQKVFWSRRLEFDAGDSLAAVDAGASLAFEATEALSACQGAAGDVENANAMATAALKHVFSFDPVQLEKADRMLEIAHELDPLASRPALRALAKAFLSMEGIGQDTLDLQSEAQLLVDEALQLDSENALALSFIADVYDLIFEDAHTALSFASNALRKNPGAGYALASLGGLELRRGRNVEALNSAWRAKRQLENTSLQAFAELRYCVATMTTGDFAAATLAAETASLLVPTSRPPLRHLYALRLYANDHEGARDALIALKRLEPGFSLKRVREDLDFPASTIRSTGLDQLQDVDI
ncbi:MAG: hypothetical protein ABJL67_15855 [Sulfitobacter sp.]